MGVSFKPSKECTYTTDYEFEYTFHIKGTACRFVDIGGHVRFEAWSSAEVQYTTNYQLLQDCTIEHYIAFVEERAKVL